MERTGSRRLPVAVLNERRRRAVMLRLSEMTITQVCTLAELARATVIAVIKACQRGGWDAVPAQLHRGPQKGECWILNADPQQAIQGLIHAHTPDELGLPFALWSRAAVSALIEKEYGMTLLVTDITYLPTREGSLDLASVKDVFTCEIMGYAMGERMTQTLTAKALWHAVRNKRPPAGVTHHSDRGSQYCAHDYRKLLKQFGMTASMSRKGNCYGNAPMESFWGSLKNELTHHHQFETRAHAKAAIQESIEIFYDRQRCHSRLSYVWPAVFAETYKHLQAA